ncbi:MAG: gluconokinase [Acidimicrobiia bacterium]|nr:gluconokinase [Acidimicrobiia bacterium]MDH3471417.1 gluconokinase [Acidimicrobiia bacterium]
MGYVVVVMGVSGSGKTTVGKSLAAELGAAFVDADDYHSPQSIEKMASGIALDDNDRLPWLALLRGVIDDHLATGTSLVLACSAMKQVYRDQLAAQDPQVHFVFLKGDYDTIARRLEEREGHYMKADMLQSQFDALEEPADAVMVDADAGPSEIVARALEGLVARRFRTS